MKWSFGLLVFLFFGSSVSYADIPFSAKPGGACDLSSWRILLKRDPRLTIPAAEIRRTSSFLGIESDTQLHLRKLAAKRLFPHVKKVVRQSEGFRLDHLKTQEEKAIFLTDGYLAKNGYFYWIKFDDFDVSLYSLRVPENERSDPTELHKKKCDAIDFCWSQNRGDAASMAEVLYFEEQQKRNGCY